MRKVSPEDLGENGDPVDNYFIPNNRFLHVGEVVNHPPYMGKHPAVILA
jgi:hypothetical protein